MTQETDEKYLDMFLKSLREIKESGCSIEQFLSLQSHVLIKIICMNFKDKEMRTKVFEQVVSGMLTYLDIIAEENDK